MQIQKKIADKIRFYRTNRQMKQADFAKSLGVTRVTVSNWERGKVPDLLTLHALARYTDWRFHLAKEILDLVLSDGNQEEGGQGSDN